MTMSKSLDMPPVWLVGTIVLAWVQQKFLPLGLSLRGPFVDLLAGVLCGGGILLMAPAIYEMRRQNTTVIPHRVPDTLVQSGIFSRTRNPIYLGDVMFLAGVLFWLDAVLSLVLVPVFLWVLERRFIIPEENRIRRAFRADWGRYEQKVRRWV